MVITYNYRKQWPGYDFFLGRGFKNRTQKSKLIIVVNVFNGKRNVIIYYLIFVSFQ